MKGHNDEDYIMYRGSPMGRIFISYSRSDKRDVEQFISYLPANYKRQIWYDKDIKAGEEWWQRILNQIEKADIFIFLISNEALLSEHCQKEFRQALNLKKHIIPVIMRRCDLNNAPSDICEVIKSIHWINMQDGMTIDNYRELLDAIDHLSSLVQQTTIANVIDSSDITIKIEHYIKRGLFHLQNKDHERAIESFTCAIQIDRSNAIAYAHRGRAYGNAQDYINALQDAEQSILLDPKLAIGHFIYGKVYSKDKDYYKAIANYNQAIRLDPDYYNAYKSRGDVYFNLKQYQEAISDYKQAIRLDVNSIHSYVALGLIHKHLNQNQQSLKYFVDAIRCAPQSIDDYNDRAMAYEQLGKCQQAIADYQKALEINPNYLRAQNNLDRVLRNCQPE
jgi:tetratricopeptide (TPR) repeat protein